MRQREQELYQRKDSFLGRVTRALKGSLFSGAAARREKVITLLIDTTHAVGHELNRESDGRFTLSPRITDPGSENDTAWTRVLIQVVDAEEEQPNYHTLVDLGVSWDGQEIRFNPVDHKADREWAKLSWLSLDKEDPKTDAVPIRQFFAEHLVADHDSPLVRFIAQRLPARKEKDERPNRKDG